MTHFFSVPLVNMGGRQSNLANAAKISTTSVLTNSLTKLMTQLNQSLATEQKVRNVINASVNTNEARQVMKNIALYKAYVVRQANAAAVLANRAARGAPGAPSESATAEVVKQVTQEVSQKTRNLAAFIGGLQGNNTIGAYLNSGRNANANLANIGNNAALRSFFKKVYVRRANMLANQLKTGGYNAGVTNAMMRNLNQAMSLANTNANRSGIEKRKRNYGKGALLEPPINVNRLGATVWNRASGGFTGLAINTNFNKIAREIESNANHANKLRQPTSKNALLSYLRSKNGNTGQKQRANAIVRALYPNTA